MDAEPHRTLHAQDFYAWTQDQAARLRAADVAGLDLEHLAEEIEGLGISQRSEVRSRLEVLIQHLLKWQFQPDLQSRSWRNTIASQRSDLEDLLADNPSLRRYPAEALARAYARGRKRAVRETGAYRIPETCPFELEQILDPAWFPEPPSSP